MTPLQKETLMVIDEILEKGMFVPDPTTLSCYVSKILEIKHAAARSRIKNLIDFGYLKKYSKRVKTVYTFKDENGLYSCECGCNEFIKFTVISEIYKCCNCEKEKKHK